MTVPRPVIVDEPAAASGHELTLSAGTNRARTASAVVQPGDVDAHEFVDHDIERLHDRGVDDSEHVFDSSRPRHPTTRDLTDFRVLPTNRHGQGAGTTT